MSPVESNTQSGAVIPPTATIAEAARAMCHFGVDTLLIVDPVDDTQVGRICEHDVVRVIASGRDPSMVSVAGYVCEPGGTCTCHVPPEVWVG